jgi:uncharacterized protein
MPDSKRVDTPWGPVSVVVDGTGGARTLVFAHGAGGDMRSQFMEEVSAGLADKDIEVWRFNFAYSEAGRKSPDKAPVLEGVFEAVADAASTGGPVFLGGKSMGGRIASHLAAAGYKTSGLIFFGYPLHPPGRPDRIRDEHLADIAAPTLFIEGTRDPFCPLDTLDAVFKKRKLKANLKVIDDGDHSFKVRKSSGRDTPAAWSEVVDAAARWIAGH